MILLQKLLKKVYGHLVDSLIYKDKLSANINENIQFIENTIEGKTKSRFWTFEDGTPSTSTSKITNVSFNSQGTKTITLSITGWTGIDYEQTTVIIENTGSTTTSIYFQNSPRLFYSGETLQLVVLNQDDIDVTSECIFTSSAENLGTVDENGLLTIVVTEGDSGDLTITATHTDGPISNYLSVVHYEKIEEIASIPSSFTKNLGYLSFTELLTGTTDQLLILNQDSIDVTTACTFESDNLNLATVSSDGTLDCIYYENSTSSNNTVNVTVTYELLTTNIILDITTSNCAIYSGPDQTINVADELILSGSTVGILRTGFPLYWEQVGGTPVTITNSGSSTTTITGFDVGEYLFRYRCSCRNRLNIYDQVSITVTSNSDQFTVVVNDDTFTFNSVDNSWIGLTINWGDGSPDLVVSDIGDITHNYATIDTYVIIISGNISGITGGFSIYQQV